MLLMQNAHSHHVREGPRLFLPGQLQLCLLGHLEQHAEFQPQSRNCKILQAPRLNYVFPYEIMAILL